MYIIFLLNIAKIFNQTKKDKIKLDDSLNHKRHNYCHLKLSRNEIVRLIQLCTTKPAQQN